MEINNNNSTQNNIEKIVFPSTHYIMTDEKLTTDEYEFLTKILESFPHVHRDWQEKFSKFIYKFDPQYISIFELDIIPKNILLKQNYFKKMLKIAANAYDSNGNTVLGVACEWGKNVNFVQKLIDMGANLDTPDRQMNKLALHWAINNKLSFYKPESIEAVAVVQCLLDNGAKTDITCYQNATPLEYAISRGYKAAAIVIENHINKTKLL